MTWVTDMTRFLDEDGLIAEMPAPASRLVDYFGQIVSAASSTSMGISVELDVECRRRPDRRRCGGRIEALIDFKDCIRLVRLAPSSLRNLSLDVGTVRGEPARFYPVNPTYPE